ncbi:MAG: hypothetical protein GY780_02480, partial [bacterium]|nr:hypothetical protein [bacterium]
LMEIDADEVWSNHYLENKSNLLPQMVSQAVANTKNQSREKAASIAALKVENRVDINELRRVDSGESCWSPGVGPCTALVAYSPGQFGYLIHISPTDQIYNDDPLTPLFLGTRHTDMVNKLLQRITHFDTVGNDVPKLQFIIAATHTDSIEGILDTLLGRGISLSKIKFAYNPSCDFANIKYTQTSDSVQVSWITLDPGLGSQELDATKLPNLMQQLNTYR